MFGFIEDLAKAAVSVVTLPVAIVADVVTLGNDSYTEDALNDVVDNLKNAIKPDAK